MKDISDVIEAVNGAATTSDAFCAFASYPMAHGYERVAYSLITDHPSLSLPKQHGLATSYPDDWMKYYDEQKYFSLDPVVHGVIHSRVPFFWSDLKATATIPESSFKVLQQGHDSGLKDGLAIPLFGYSGEVVGLGLARKEADKGRDYQFLANVCLLSTFFHEKFRSLLTQPILVKITPKERDIISWAAEGKTDEEIAIILGLSANTVRWYWKNIFVKLDTKGRLYTITKAIALGLVSPQFVSARPL